MFSDQALACLEYLNIFPSVSDVVLGIALTSLLIYRGLERLTCPSIKSNFSTNALVILLLFWHCSNRIKKKSAASVFQSVSLGLIDNSFCRMVNRDKHPLFLVCLLSRVLLCQNYAWMAAEMAHWDVNMFRFPIFMMDPFTGSKGASKWNKWTPSPNSPEHGGAKQQGRRRQQLSPKGGTILPGATLSS